MKAPAGIAPALLAASVSESSQARSRLAGFVMAGSDSEVALADGGIVNPVSNTPYTLRTMARRRQAFNSDLSSYADPATNANPANRTAANAAPSRQQQQQHPRHHRPVRAPGPVHAKVAHDVDVKTVKTEGEPEAQVIEPVEEMDGLAIGDEEDDGEDGETTDDDGRVAPPLPSVSDEETCFICAEKITYFAVGVCGHTTCQ